MSENVNMQAESEYRQILLAMEALGREVEERADNIINNLNNTETKNLHTEVAMLLCEFNNRLYELKNKSASVLRAAISGK